MLHQADRRRGAEDIVLIAADELAGLLETAHLLRSPRNTERLLRALVHSEYGEGQSQSIDELKEAVGLGEE
jgi:antitoxin YefM